MQINDDDVNTLLERTKRIEYDQKRLMRTVYGDDEYPGIRAIVNTAAAKTDKLDTKITGYEQRIHGAKYVIGGGMFLLSSGAVAAIISVLSGG
jgi:hypothetical protein